MNNYDSDFFNWISGSAWLFSISLISYQLSVIWLKALMIKGHAVSSSGQSGCCWSWRETLEKVSAPSQFERWTYFDCFLYLLCCRNKWTNKKQFIELNERECFLLLVHFGCREVSRSDIKGSLLVNQEFNYIPAAWQRDCLSASYLSTQNLFALLRPVKSVNFCSFYWKCFHSPSFLCFPSRTLCTVVQIWLPK